MLFGGCWGARSGPCLPRNGKTGCKFALDDFGSGVASFSYLKNFSGDYLKIDVVFVRDIVRRPVSFAMVESINQVEHVLGMRAIAEFVEDGQRFK